MSVGLQRLREDADADPRRRHPQGRGPGARRPRHRARRRTAPAAGRERGAQGRTQHRLEADRRGDQGAAPRPTAPRSPTCAPPRPRPAADHRRSTPRWPRPQADLDDLLLRIPNPPDPDIPVGGEEANVTIRIWGEQLAHDQPLVGEVGADAPAGGATWTRRPHWELGEALDIIDNARGAKIAGSGFPVYKGAGSALQRGLINWFLDVHTRENGMTEVWPPAVVNTASATGTGQIPDKEDQMYVVTRDELYLVPTAEVPVTNLHRDEILEATELPIRYAAYSPCFRREAGAAGKDTRGIMRVHQFDKVEMVLFERPEDSAAALEWMTERAEILLQRLGLAYRVLLMSTREMGFTQARKYDLEVWAPGVERWLEVSSCSNFRDFQARRMAIRYRPEPGAKPELVHTLNGSGLALARIVAALLETYQRPDGSIEVPEVLRPTWAATRSPGTDRNRPGRSLMSCGAPQPPEPRRRSRARPRQLHSRRSASRGTLSPLVKRDRDRTEEGRRPERVIAEALPKAEMSRRLPRAGQAAGRTGQAGHAPERADDGRAAKQGARQDDGPRDQDGRDGAPIDHVRRSGRRSESSILPIAMRIRSTRYQMPQPPKVMSLRTPSAVYPR